MPLLRGLLFNLGYALGIIAFSVSSWIAAPILTKRQRFHVLRVFTQYLEWWLRVSCGIRYQVSGAENILPTPCVIVANHQSTWETFFIPQHFSPLSPVLKKELLYIPFYGRSVLKLEPIVIDRSKVS